MALLLPQTLHFCVFFSSPFVGNGLKKYRIRGAWPLVQRRIHVCCIHVAWKRFPASAWLEDCEGNDSGAVGGGSMIKALKVFLCLMIFEESLDLLFKVICLRIVPL